MLAHTARDRAPSAPFLPVRVVHGAAAVLFVCGAVAVGVVDATVAVAVVFARVYGTSGCRGEQFIAVAINETSFSGRIMRSALRTGIVTKPGVGAVERNRAIL